jgi:photosystem II stability/assembly factor-like uncharacterized protein
MLRRSMVASRAACVLLGVLTWRHALAAGGEWRLAATRAFELPARYAGFVDERSGITVGPGGLVHYTRDGGRTWSQGLIVSASRHALEMLPDGLAWNAGILNVCRSFNGGKTWYRGGAFGSGAPNPALFLSFADENRGLVANLERLGMTADGGLSWTDVPLPDGVGEIAAVSLSVAPPPERDTSPAMVALETIRKVVGRVLDRSGRLWTTEDGGRTWRGAESPLAGQAFHVAGRAPTVALRFTPSGEGILAAFVQRAGGHQCRIFRLAAGAGDWREERVSLMELGTLFLSPDGNLLTAKPFDREVILLYARTERKDRR